MKYSTSAIECTRHGILVGRNFEQLFKSGKPSRRGGFLHFGPSPRGGLSASATSLQDGVSALVRSLEPHGPEAVRDGLLEAYPSLAQAHGETAAASAAEFYDASNFEVSGGAASRGFPTSGETSSLTMPCRTRVSG
ncbi:VG15 protein [Berryella wangjianweii]